MPIGLTTADGGVNAKYKATVRPNSDVPALLGLNCMQQSEAILDLRQDKLHMWIARNLDGSSSCANPDILDRLPPGGKERVLAGIPDDSCTDAEKKTAYEDLAKFLRSNAKWLFPRDARCEYLDSIRPIVK